MSKARELASLGNVYSDGALSNRNAIINGSFKVAQRGTNIDVRYPAFGLDRWYSTGGDGTDARYMQQIENTSVPVDCTHYMKHTKSIANEAWIFQRIEGVKQFSGKTLTLSYYAWVDSGSTQVTSGGWGLFNGSYGNVSGYAGNTITVTTTPTKFVHTFTFADVLSTAASASDFFELNWYRNTATNLNLANVQLEVGDTATPFEHRSYGQELALCQRYYWRLNSEGYNTPIAMAQAETPTVGITIMNLPVGMRAAPSFTDSGGASDFFYYDGGGDFFSGFSGYGSSKYTAMFYKIFSTTAFVDNQALTLRFNNANAWLAWDAEL